MNTFPPGGPRQRPFQYSILRLVFIVAACGISFRLFGADGGPRGALFAISLVAAIVIIRRPTPGEVLGIATLALVGALVGISGDGHEKNGLPLGSEICASGGIFTALVLRHFEKRPR